MLVLPFFFFTILWICSALLSGKFFHTCVLASVFWMKKLSKGLKRDISWDKEPFSSVWDPVHQGRFLGGQTNWFLNMTYWQLHFLLCKWSNYQTLSGYKLHCQLSHLSRVGSVRDLATGERCTYSVYLLPVIIYIFRSNSRSCFVLLFSYLQRKICVASHVLLAFCKHLLLTQSG